MPAYDYAGHLEYSSKIIIVRWILLNLKNNLITDKEKIIPNLNLPLKSRSCIEAQTIIPVKKPLAPPVLKSGYWKDGRFYEDSDSRNADGSTILRLKQ